MIDFETRALRSDEKGNGGVFWAVFDKTGPRHSPIFNTEDSADKWLNELEGSNRDALVAWWSDCPEYNTRLSNFIDYYQGTYGTWMRFVYHLIDTGTFGKISTFMEPYIDYELLSADLRRDFVLIDCDKGVHIFCA